jgi:hypothetical protein
MSVTYTPSKTNALYANFSGLDVTDPVGYTAHDSINLNAKHFYVPIQNEILKLIDVAQTCILSGSPATGGLTGYYPAPLIASAAISGNTIAANSILKGHLANSIISGNIIAANAILNGHLANASVSGNVISANSILTGHLSNASISGSIIAANSIMQGHLAPNCIGSNEIIDGSVANLDLASAAISGNVIAANSILTGHLANAAISGNVIAANVIQAGHLSNTLHGNLDLNNEIAVSSGPTNATIGRMHYCTGSSSYLINLPAVSGNAGRQIGFRFGPTSALSVEVTVVGNGAELISGKNSRVFTHDEHVILSCNGTSWNIVSQWLLPVRTKGYRNTTSQAVGAGAYTKVAFNAETIDSEIAFDSTGLASSGIFTVPVTGDYMITTSIAFSGASAPQRYIGKLMVNGNYVNLFFDNNLGTGGNFALGGSCVSYNMTKGHRCQLDVYSDKSATVDFTEANTNVIFQRILTNE